MKPSELLKLVPIEESKEIYHLIDFMQDLNLFNVDYSANERVITKYYVNEQVDSGGRVFRILSIWLDDTPVMVSVHSGDSGENQNNRVINKPKYYEMISYLRSLSEECEPSSVSFHDVDEEIPFLTTDRYYKMETYYNPEMTPLYKDGDIVRALVMEDHLRDCYKNDPVMIETRCEICAVYPKNPKGTYRSMQLDRRWETKEEVESRHKGKETNTMYRNQQVIFDKNKGHLGAMLNDSLIIGLWEE